MYQIHTNTYICNTSLLFETDSKITARVWAVMGFTVYNMSTGQMVLE